MSRFLATKHTGYFFRILTKNNWEKKPRRYNKCTQLNGGLSEVNIIWVLYSHKYNIIDIIFQYSSKISEFGLFLTFLSIYYLIKKINS